jgi:hypothetical protein
VRRTNIASDLNNTTFENVRIFIRTIHAKSAAFSVTLATGTLIEFLDWNTTRPWRTRLADTRVVAVVDVDAKQSIADQIQLLSIDNHLKNQSTPHQIDYLLADLPQTGACNYSDKYN